MINDLSNTLTTVTTGQFPDSLFKFPIFVYLGVILSMGVSACTGRDTNGIIIAGAGLFSLSNALIAYPMFVEPIAHSSFWVMFTYYAAQALLTSGTLKMKTE